MHPFVRQISVALEIGEQLRLSDLGDWDALCVSVEDVGTSLVAEEFARMILAEVSSRDSEAQSRLIGLLYAIFERARSDLVIPSLVESIDQLPEIPCEVAKQFLDRALVIAADTTIQPLARGAALDCGLRMALRTGSPRGLKHTLCAFLVDVGLDEPSDFLGHAAKITGVAYSHWQMSDLKDKLDYWSKIQKPVVEAVFERGIAELVDGLRITDYREGRHALEAARFWFSRVSSISEDFTEARAYSICLAALFDFEAEQSEDVLFSYIEDLKRCVREYSAYYDASTSPSWLGGRHVQIMAWAQLACSVHESVLCLGDGFWDELESVVRRGLLSVLSINRSIVRKNTSGLIGEIVRPRIVASLVSKQWQLEALRRWLVRNCGNSDAMIVESLVRAAEESLEKNESDGLTEKAEFMVDLVGSIVGKLETGTGSVARLEVLHAIAATMRQYIDDLSETALATFENCIEATKEHDDYRCNENGRTLFSSVLLWTISFLESRCNFTKKNAPEIKYLFEASDGKLPLEAELQKDYSGLMRAIVGSGSRIEMDDVSGGRADVWFKCGGEHLVVEVKREMVDASFDALADSYSAQASEYQNTSIRLGFVLVLDLTKVQTAGSPHMSELVCTRRIWREGETRPRWVVFVKVPARRRTPSQLKG